MKDVRTTQGVFVPLDVDRNYFHASVYHKGYEKDILQFVCQPTLGALMNKLMQLQLIEGMV